MRKLELDSLQAELSTLDARLARRTEKEDPPGWLQLTHRRADVAARLARMESDLPANAEVAVFFGATPVVGSRGIRADFAADAISHDQELDTRRMASQATVIDETVIRREGVLFLVPDARRFELHPTAGPVLKGIVAPNVIQRNGQDEHPGALDAADIVGKRWLVELHEKTVKQGSGKSRASYTLLRFIEFNSVARHRHRARRWWRSQRRSAIRVNLSRTVLRRTTGLIADQIVSRIASCPNP